MNFIEELYYGGIQPNLKDFSENPAYGKAMAVFTRSEAALTATLEGSLQSVFLDLINAQNELEGIIAYESFLDGFLLGAHFVRDTFFIDHRQA